MNDKEEQNIEHNTSQNEQQEEREIIHKNKKTRRKSSTLPDILSSLKNKLAEKDEEFLHLHRAFSFKSIYLTVLRQIYSLLSSNLGLEKALNIVLDLAIKHLNVQTGSILVLDESGTFLRFVSARGEKAEEVKKFVVKIGQGISGWVAQENQTIAISDVHKDSRFDKTIDEAIGFTTTSIIAAPIAVRGSVIGVIELINKLSADTIIVQEEIELVEAIANLTGVMFDNLTAVDKKSKIVKKLTKIVEESANLSILTNIKEVLSKTTAFVSELLPLSEINIFLIDSEIINKLTNIFSHSEIEQINLKQCTDIADSEKELVSYCFTNRRPMWIKSLKDDNKFSPLSETIYKYANVSIICVPLCMKLLNEEINLGVIECIRVLPEAAIVKAGEGDNQKANSSPFNEEDLKILYYAAMPVAAQIKRLR